MKKITIILTALILSSFLFASCQKAKETEGKKEVLVQQAQKEEVAQQPAEIKFIETKPEGQTKQEQTPQEIVGKEKEIEFKEPVLLWEREFDPPIREISDQNSNGDFLAIQVKKEEGSGRPLMQKLLVIDSKGKTKREELLPKKKSITIPADQLWLTAASDDELTKLRKAKKPQQVTAWGKEMYISGNGEYYATVIQYGGWYEFEYKDKNGKTLWKISPNDNYGFEKAYISYDGSRIVIIDMGGLGGGDVWEVLGQRVYFYDNTGKLLKDYDFGEKMEEWLGSEDGRNIVLSHNGRYIAMTRGWGKNPDRTVILFDAMGNILWEKMLAERHGLSIVTSAGIVPVVRHIIDAKGNVRLNYSAIKKVKLDIADKQIYLLVEKESKETNEFLLSLTKNFPELEIVKVDLEKIKPKEAERSNLEFSPDGKYLVLDLLSEPKGGYYSKQKIYIYNKYYKLVGVKDFEVTKLKDADKELYFFNFKQSGLLIGMNFSHTKVFIYRFSTGDTK